jgi:hypothetical protein
MIYFLHTYHAVQVYISPFQFSTVHQDTKQASECLTWTET